VFAKQLKTHLFDKMDLSVAEDIHFVLFVYKCLRFQSAAATFRLFHPFNLIWIKMHHRIVHGFVKDLILEMVTRIKFFTGMGVPMGTGKREVSRGDTAVTRTGRKWNYYTT